MATKVLPVNAYRASEAEAAVRQELRKRGITGRVTGSALRAGERLPFDQVAIVVTRSSDGRPVPEHLRFTYDVTVETA